VFAPRQAEGNSCKLVSDPNQLDRTGGKAQGCLRFRAGREPRAPTHLARIDSSGFCLEPPVPFGQPRPIRKSDVLSASVPRRAGKRARQESSRSLDLAVAMNDKSLKDVLKDWDADREGADLYGIVSALYPICRSITGNGLRQSLRLLQKQVPLTLREVPTGTHVFDWVVPKEWNIRDAYVKNTKGEKIIDFQQCNLHVVNYSVPVHQKMPLAELRARLFTLPESPDWIPYRTSYYKENWGFCLSQRQLEYLEDGEYEVCIDSTLEPGHLTYGEFRIQGGTDEEVLISCHSCHPSLCNDNLSGMAVAAKLAQHISGTKPRYSYRFLWVAGAIGPIAWLAMNEPVIPQVKHGLVLSCVGDPGPFTYKRSRRGNAEIDRAVEQVLRSSGAEFKLLDFSPLGNEERQYNSPGIKLPVGCFMRTPNGKYPQYHSSADNLNLVTASALAETLSRLLSVVHILEGNRCYLNLNPKCEPQLGRRGLYSQMGGTKSNSDFEEAMLWILNFCDGEHSLLDIAERSRLDFATLDEVAEVLLRSGLLRRAN
jgi:aminopeptidase-like protein